MADVEYMHLCDYAFIGENGKQCIIGIFDWIAGANFPLTYQQIYLAIKFKGTPHEIIKGIRIEIGRPNGDVMAKIEGPPVNANADGTATVNVGLHGVVFPDHGRYTVKLSRDGQTLLTKSLQVKRMSAAASPPPTVAH